MPLQSQEELLGLLDLEKDPPRRYLHLKIFVHSPSLLSTSSHANLATKALLKLAHLLKPKPPLAFGPQIESHDLRKQAWDFDSLTPHQNVQNKESNLEVTALGRIKDDIIYEGIEEAIDRISVVRVFLPACESVFIFQPCTFSITSAKASCFLALIFNGSHKYFPLGAACLRLMMKDRLM